MNELDFFANMDSFMREGDKTIRRIFGKHIKGNFLIEMKYRVLNELGESFLTLYDFSWSDERMVTGNGPEPEYDICKHIVGVHRSNTIFFTPEEKSKIEKDENYKLQLTKQVADQIRLRAYGSAYFRSKIITLGERFNYYPIPYELFVLCTRMHSICYQKGAIGDSAYYFAKIINK